MGCLTFDQLEKKHGMFLHPGCFVKLEGKELGEEFPLDEVTVDLPYSYEAGSCSFIVTNAFGNTSQTQVELRKELRQLLELGKKIELYLGYENGTKVLVFTGYVDGIYLDFNRERAELRCQIECLDAKGIMMNSLHSEQKKNVTRYSDAVQDILKKYPKLIRKRTIDDTGEQKVLIEQQKESDYEFICRLAKQLNYRFYLLKEEAFFQKHNADTEEFFHFNIDEYMEEFHLYTTLDHQVKKVVVRGSNEQDPAQPFEAEAVSYQSNVDRSKIEAGNNQILSSRVVKTIIDLSVTSESEAKARAEAELTRLSCFQAKGSVVTVGVPDFIPGKVVSVEGFGEAADRSYRISRVIHRFHKESYTTECELEGNKL